MVTGRMGEMVNRLIAGMVRLRRAGAALCVRLTGQPPVVASDVPFVCHPEFISGSRSYSLQKERRDAEPSLHFTP